MKSKMETTLLRGWPKANLVERSEGRNLCAYEGGRLTAEISLYPEQRWAFFHYHHAYGAPRYADRGAALNSFHDEATNDGWTCAVKGPTFAEENLPGNERDFVAPTREQIGALGQFVETYLRKRFPRATIAETALYAGAAWAFTSEGRDGLGVRDLDVNVFFKAGGPRSLAWITKLRHSWNGVERVVDLYWNTLAPGQTPAEYMAAKFTKAKSGRWLTIGKRPWVSLKTLKVIHLGEMG